MTPYLAQLMDDPYSAVRYIAHRSLRSLPGAKAPAFDFTTAPGRREPVFPKIAGAWLKSTNATSGATPALLFQPGNKLDQKKFFELLKARDNTSVDLQE